MRELVGRRARALIELTELSEEVVAPCAWCVELLARNGVADEKLHLVRQALPGALDENGVGGGNSPAALDSEGRIAFLGRVDPIKGLDVLVEAWHATPALGLGLDVYAVVQSPQDDVRLATLRRIAGGDSRIAFVAPIPNGEVVARLRAYDALAVPTLALETGPLVVLEAFAAGRPVIGSNLGGVAELVREGVDGLLVEPTRQGWRRALETVAMDPALLQRLRDGVVPPRRMDAAVAEMIPIYERARLKRQGS
jgi:glycosyltransferase involved in cell wall biosynthesis